MTTNYDFDSGFKNEPQIPVPNATVILVLGILSIVTCCCYGILGIILATTALILASSAGKLYNAEPDRYTKSSYSNVNAGKICAIIGLILSIAFAIYMAWAIAYIGIDALTNPELLQERLQELMNQ